MADKVEQKLITAGRSNSENVLNVLETQGEQNEKGYYPGIETPVLRANVDQLVQEYENLKRNHWAKEYRPRSYDLRYNSFEKLKTEVDSCILKRDTFNAFEKRFSKKRDYQDNEEEISDNLDKMKKNKETLQEYIQNCECINPKLAEMTDKSQETRDLITNACDRFEKECSSVPKIDGANFDDFANKLAEDLVQPNIVNTVTSFFSISDTTEQLMKKHDQAIEELKVFFSGFHGLVEELYTSAENGIEQTLEIAKDIAEVCDLDDKIGKQFKVFTRKKEQSWSFSGGYLEEQANYSYSPALPDEMKGIKSVKRVSTPEGQEITYLDTEYVIFLGRRDPEGMLRTKAEKEFIEKYNKIKNSDSDNEFFQWIEETRGKPVYKDISQEYTQKVDVQASTSHQSNSPRVLDFVRRSVKSSTTSFVTTAEYKAGSIHIWHELGDCDAVLLRTSKEDGKVIFESPKKTTTAQKLLQSSSNTRRHLLGYPATITTTLTKTEYENLSQKESYHERSRSRSKGINYILSKTHFLSEAERLTPITGENTEENGEIIRENAKIYSLLMRRLRDLPRQIKEYEIPKYCDEVLKRIEEYNQRAAES